MSSDIEKKNAPASPPGGGLNTPHMDPHSRPQHGTAPGSGAALTIKDSKLAELQGQMDQAIETSGFLPLMGAFQEYIENERRRSRRQVAALGALFIAVLALFLIGPILTGRAFLKRAETAFSSERKSFQQFSTGVQSGLSALAKATAELRQTVEMQRRLLQSQQPEAAGALSLSLAAAATNAVATTGSEVTSAPPVQANSPAPSESRKAAGQDQIMQIVSEIEATIAAIDHQKQALPRAEATASNEEVRTGESAKKKADQPDAQR